MEQWRLPLCVCGRLHEGPCLCVWKAAPDMRFQLLGAMQTSDLGYALWPWSKRPAIGQVRWVTGLGRIVGAALTLFSGVRAFASRRRRDGEARGAVGQPKCEESVFPAPG